MSHSLCANRTVSPSSIVVICVGNTICEKKLDARTHRFLDVFGGPAVLDEDVHHRREAVGVGVRHALELGLGERMTDDDGTARLLEQP